MLTFPNIDPIAFSVGPLPVYWYGLTYLVGFIGCYLLLVWAKKGTEYNSDVIGDLLFYTAVGIILGGRVGFVLFYFPQEFFTNPLSALAFWLPGRSFHGGLLGVIIAMFVYAKLHKKNVIEITDCIAPVVPFGLGCGRIGNFLNGELWGRPTDVPWGMVFPHVDLQPRHPSQLYELVLEGIVMCVWLMWYARRERKIGNVSGLFLILYGAFRAFIELFREPDVTHGFIAFDFITMGHLLSLPMIILGIILMYLPEDSRFFKR